MRLRVRQRSTRASEAAKYSFRPRTWSSFVVVVVVMVARA
jgi:hypothetical protein